jgi:hypothetical protein
MNNIKKAALALAAVALGGCASLSQPDDPRFVDGRVVATVLSAYAPDAPRDSLPPCLASLSPEQFAQRRFVKVRYRRHRVARTEVAELAPAQLLKEGDRIELWPASCSAGKLSRSGRVITPSQPGADTKNAETP